MWIIRYLLYVLEHKRNVFMACWRRGLYVHAFTHDLSKFSPAEFIPYALYFYKDKVKYKDQFDRAWRHHYMRNPHHWDHWAMGEFLSTMTDYDIECMIADWEGMAMKFGGTAQAYYLKHYDKIRLDYNTRLSLENKMGLNVVRGSYRRYAPLADIISVDGPRYFRENFGWIQEKYDVNLLEVLKVK